MKKVIESKIRDRAGKSTGKLTKADLEKVTTLNLDSIILTEVKELEKLTQLQKLVLQYNQLTKIPKGLENLTQLGSLNLDHNRLTDVKGLEKLTELSLGGNELTNVKGLENLTQLRELFLLNNLDLTKAQIAELQKALPNCKITSNPTK